MCVPGLSRKPADISTYVAQESIYMGGVCQRLWLHIPFTMCLRNWTGASDLPYCLAVGWLHITICVFLYSNSALCLSHCWSLQTSDLAGTLLWCNRSSLTRERFFSSISEETSELDFWETVEYWNIWNYLAQNKYIFHGVGDSPDNNREPGILWFWVCLLKINVLEVWPPVWRCSRTYKQWG